MIKEASESNFGAKKVFSKKLKWESPYFSNCDLHEALDILSLLVHSETLWWEWDGFHFRVQILRTKIYPMIALTFFHGPPTKTPSIRCPAFISVEIDLNFVCFGCYDLWLGVAAAVVHQSCPVPIGDSDKVARACRNVTWTVAKLEITWRTTRGNSKGCELKPQ